MGPQDRILIAQSYLGTSYKQETGSAYRTGSDASALQYMDCSEYVSRVIAGDGITDGVQHLTSSGINNMVKDVTKFEESITPQSGDIVSWDGHTGIVEDFNSETNEVTTLHATSYTKNDGTKVESAVRETYSTDYYNEKGASFSHPTKETPDVLGKTFSGGELDPVTVTGEGRTTMEPIYQEL